MRNSYKDRTIRILIPNATSPRNLGDQITLSVLIDLIRKNIKNANITIHSNDPHLYKKTRSYKVYHTLYSWAVFEKRNAAVRMLRLLWLAANFIELRFDLKLLALFNIKTKLDELILDYKSADLIIFADGGYLRAKKGLTQSLNLLMNLFIFHFAKQFRAKKIVGPISFGPFYSNWQEKLTAAVLDNLDLVATREKYSYQHLKKYNINNLISAYDYGILASANKNKKTKNKKLILAYTIRNWLEGENQKKFETAFVGAIAKFANETGSKVLPIVHTDAPMYGEDDSSLTTKIAWKLSKYKVKVMNMGKTADLKTITNKLSKADLLLGMRMHSNILAAVNNIPFVAISYEYKTEGIASDLGMRKFCIKCNLVTKDKLYKLLIEAKNKRFDLRRNLNTLIKYIRNREDRRWGQLINKIVYE